MSLMGINWQIVGIEAVRAVFYVLLSLVSAALVFRKYIAPDLTAALEEAQKVASTLASIGGIKKADLQTGKDLEKIVASEYIAANIPEMEAARLVLSPDTWEKIEEAIERNPAAVMTLWEKWKPYFTSEATEETTFDF